MSASTAELRRRIDVVGGLPMHSRYSIERAPAGRQPVVLVHGLVVSSAYVAPALLELAPDHPSYAPDLPGYGWSAKPPRQYDLTKQADYLAGWMTTVGLGRTAIVGCSLGTQIVSLLAVRHPELVERAVLLGPTMDPAGRSRLVSLSRWARELPHEVPMMPLMLRDYARAGLRRAMHAFEMALADRPEERFPHMSMPTLVVRGELDPIVPQGWAETVTELLPHARLTVVERQAHALNLTAPAEFARIVRQFLDEGASLDASGALAPIGSPEHRREAAGNR
jgi:2-hydroxy-6-oxonona-2,4-dienedioate hydrolase